MTDAGYEYALRATRVSKRFGTATVLSEVDFDVRHGEVHALVGENGAGKTTLLRILSGHEQPTTGELEVLGVRHQLVDPVVAQHLGLAIVPQHVELVPDLSVAENLFLNRWPTRHWIVDRQRMRSESAEALAELGVELDPNVIVRELSYVQRQMVEIARLTRFDPRVIFLDEPTAALSVREIKALFGLIGRLRARGLGVVYVSHFLNEIGQVADRLSIMRNGRIVSSGPSADYNTAAIVRHMVGRIDDLYPRRSTPVAPRSIWRAAIHSDAGLEVDFEVAGGEVIGIAASKGEGISDGLRSLGGIGAVGVKARLAVDGRPIDLRGSRRSTRAGVGYLSEERSRWGIFWGRSLRENVTISSLRRYLSRLGLIDRGAEDSGARRLLDEYLVRAPGLEASMNELSGGNQQKALLARVMAASLRLYLLDDPTSGVDVGSKAEINRLINSVAESGTAIVLHTADLFELLGMSDRVIVIKGGRVAEGFARGEITEAALEALLESEIHVAA